MREVMATANVVGNEMLESDASVTAVLTRREIEAALHRSDPIGLWFDIANEDAESVRLNVQLPAADVQEALRRSPDDDVAFTLDARSLSALYDDSDVEAHGLRGALAIAVAVGAFAAPAGLAATPQPASTALKPGVAHTALKPQVAHTALARTALKPQVAHTALARTALKPQVANRDVTRQAVHLVVTAAGVNAWR